MKHKPVSELIKDPNLESEDIVQYALHSKTNDNILTTNLCDLIVKYVAQQTQSLTEEIKELKAENERLGEALEQILNTNSAYFDGQISRMKDIAHNALTQNKEER